LRVALFGHRGKVGRVLGPALAAAGHEVTGIGRGDPVNVGGLDAAIDFTAPDAVVANVRACLEERVSCVVGTTGADLSAVDALARERGLPVFAAPNFAIGAVVMMSLAEQAARHLPRAEIVELHHETKRDAPSGTAKATGARLGGDPPIHSVRLPGLVAHQEVLFGAEGQLLTIRHDTFSREAFVPGVLLALERLATLPPGLTVGLETLLDGDAERNKAVFRRYGEEAWGRGNFAVLDELLTDDFVGHSGRKDRDRAALEADIRAYRDAYPGTTFEVLEQFAAGDRVATRLRAFSGTRVSTGVNISRFVDGRIAEEWAAWTGFEGDDARS
jgi:4-hydroxy-tetrahydrodipicolinate reductase